MPLYIYTSSYWFSDISPLKVPSLRGGIKVFVYTIFIVSNRLKSIFFFYVEEVVLLQTLANYKIVGTFWFTIHLDDGRVAGLTSSTTSRWRRTGPSFRKIRTQTQRTSTERGPGGYSEPEESKVFRGNNVSLELIKGGREEIAKATLCHLTNPHWQTRRQLEPTAWRSAQTRAKSW